MALVLVMGVPGVGKSTFAKRLVARLGANGFLFVFDDHLKLVRHDGDSSDGVMWEDSLREQRKCLESRIRTSLQRKFKDRSVCGIYVLDDTFHLRSMRRPFIRMARSFNMVLFILYLKKPLQLAIDGNMSRFGSSHVPEGSLRKIYDSLEEPDECASEHVIRISDDTDPGEVMKKILNSVENRKSHHNASEISCSSNQCMKNDDIWQKLDVELRRVVNEMMKECPRRATGKQLSLSRRRLLVDMRTRNIRNWDTAGLKAMLSELL
ncbi:hypothetical protein AB6A40_007527 [Gnathostoma spinigerum]|uniref:Uncharacterized protein n=1 Tax=Gnathostoma spinigerum TaxID=75299 RepID=A0ABD6EUU3_9BILA